MVQTAHRDLDLPNAAIHSLDVWRVCNGVLIAGFARDALCYLTFITTFGRKGEAA